jgi:hypothetical protein
MEPSLCTLAAASLLAAPHLLSPLEHALHLAITAGGCCVLAAVAFRLVCPAWKGWR